MYVRGDTCLSMSFLGQQWELAMFTELPIPVFKKRSILCVVLLPLYVLRLWQLVLSATDTFREWVNFFIWGVTNTCACCKTQFYTINSSESFKDYSLEIFSQACQLMFTICAAAQINAPAPNGEAWARETEWSVFNLLTGTIQKALLRLPFFQWANYKPLIIINRVSWIRASIN